MSIPTDALTDAERKVGEGQGERGERGEERVIPAEAALSLSGRCRSAAESLVALLVRIGDASASASASASVSTRTRGQRQSSGSEPGRSVVGSQSGSDSYAVPSDELFAVALRRSFDSVLLSTNSVLT